MISPRAFLDAVADHSEAKAAPNRGTRLGTVDATYSTGKPKVTLDGTTTLSADGFTFLPSYTPVAGDRVVLLPVGTTYVILGRPADEPSTEAAYQLVSEKGLANGYASLTAAAQVPFLQLPVGLGPSDLAVGSHGHDPVGSELTGTNRYHSRYHSAFTQSIPNTTNTVCSFGTTVVSGSWLIRSGFGAGHFFTPQIAGLWTFVATIRFASTAAAGERFAGFQANDLGAQQGVTAQGGVGTGNPFTINMTYTGWFDVGAFIFMEAYQSSGAALNLEGNTAWKNFTGTLVRRCT